MAQEDEDDKDMVKLKLGNLLPGKEAIVTFQLLYVLGIELGAYVLRVPASFLPTT